MTSMEQLTLLIVLLLLPVIISLSAVWYQHLVQRLPPKQQASVQQVVNTVVRSVEQEAKTLDGPGKKKAAMQLVTNMLKSMHINIPQDVIAGVIEATVYDLKQEQNQARTLSTIPTPPDPVPASTLIGAK
jgi:LL-H family phage holin